MIKLHIVTDDQNQGFKTLAAAIVSCLDSLGMVAVADDLTDAELAKLIPKLDQYLPALRAKLGNVEVVPGLPAAEASDPDAVMPEELPEPQYTNEAPSEAQIALEEALSGTRQELKQLQERFDLASAFDVARGEEARILPTYTVQRIEGQDGSYGWVIKNTAGWLFSIEHEKMLPGQKPSNDTVIDDVSVALRIGRQVYKRDLDKKDGLT